MKLVLSLFLVIFSSFSSADMDWCSYEKEGSGEQGSRSVDNRSEEVLICILMCKHIYIH